MTLIVAVLSVLAFVVAFHFLKIIPKAQEAIATSRLTATVMRDKSLDDDAKEAAVQKAAGTLMKNFLSLVVRAVLALLAAYVPIFLADLVGLLPAAEALGFLLRIDVIVVSSIVLVAVIFLGGKIWRK